MKKNLKFFGFAVIAISLSACGGNSENAQKTVEETTTPKTEHVKSEMPVAGDPELSADPTVWLDAYMKVKDALVESKPNRAKKEAKAFEKMEDINQNLKNAALRLAETKDLEEQRAIFEELSIVAFNDALQSGKKLGLYKQFCPMAFDNRGAFWLSTSEEIMNPYFGDAMLHCGVMEEQL